MPYAKAFLVFALAVNGLTAARADEGPASEVPELKELIRYVGNWNVVYESEKAPFSDGKMSAAWTLDGRFLKQTYELNAQFTQPEKLRITRLVTYDQDDNAYRAWTFISNGRTFESSGAWDGDAVTFSWTSRLDNGSISTRTDTFGKEGIQQWTSVVTNRKGDIVGQSNGTSTRIDDQ